MKFGTGIHGGERPKLGVNCKWPQDSIYNESIAWITVHCRKIVISKETLLTILGF